MSWFSALLHKKARERKLDSELRFHLEQRIQDKVAGGMNPGEARRQAAIEFGGLEQIKELCREAQSGRWLETTLQDLRFGIRTLRRTPGFTIAALATIGIGIGANSAIFSFFDAALLRPPSFSEANRIVTLFERSPQGSWGPTSTPSYLDWAKQNTTFENMAGEVLYEVALRGNEIPVQLLGEGVSAHFFDIFRVRPILGRTFVDGEDQPGRDNVAILSNKVWEENFGADPHVVGRTIILNGRPHTVVGVMPSGGVLDRQGIEIFCPLAFGPENMSREHRWLNVFAMLKPETTFEQARAEMDTIGKRIGSDYPKTNQGWRVVIRTYASSLVWPDLRQSLYVLMASVGLLMLLACANLANLTLARSIGREREVATRAALGAGRWRIVRQFLTESLLLSAAGGVFGLLAGYGAIAALKMAPPGGYLPTANSVKMDGRVLLFAMGLSLLTGILFGLFPAIRASRLDLTRAFNEGSSGAGTSRHIRGVRSALVVAEVALAFMLLCGGGLLMRSFLEMQKANIGFDPTNLAETYLPFNKTFSSGDEFNLYVHKIIDRIGALPGVRDVALTTTPPLTYHRWGLSVSFQIVGAKTTGRDLRPDCGFKVVTPSYFRTLGLRLIEGRFLSDHDTKGAPPVIVISESMAKKYFPDADPVGQHILVREPDFLSVPGPETPLEIIGIVGDEKNNGPRDQKSPGIYASEEQNPIAWQFLVVRGTSDPATLDHSMRLALRDVDRDQVMEGLFTFERIRSDYLATDRRRSWLLAIFAGIALLLAALGIYGVISYSVAQRTREIGIRSALGAQATDILGLILRGGMVLTCVGLAVGIAGAIGFSQFLTSMLFGVGRYDSLTFIAVGGALLFTAFLACYIPARRALKVNSVEALRCE